MLKDLNIKKLNQKGFTPHFLDRNMNINLKDIKKSTGFSLLEVMIAVAIITAGILGVFGLIVKTTAVGSISNNEVIASNLAQEGIEVVRNIRDTNWLKGNIFNQDISNDSIPIFTGQGGAKHNNPSDVDVWEIHNIGAGNIWKRQVYYDTNDQFYGQAKYQEGAGHFPNNWERTLFSRWIEVNSISADQIQVISYVKWTERGQSRIIIVEDHLFDWK